MNSIHAFLEEKYDRLKDGKATEEEIREMVDELLEMSKSEERSFYSYYVVLLKHMLKYVYQKERQSGSWVDSIRHSQLELSYMVDDKSLMNRVLPGLKNAYKKARRSASGETRLPLSAFPEECPADWELNNLVDYDFIDNFLVDNAYTVEVKKYLNL